MAATSADGRRTVAVVGANGFLGGELVRLLAAHPHVRVTRRCAGRAAGRRLSEVRPGLRGPADADLTAFEADDVADAAEVAFLALPHGESGLAARALRQRGVRVIDLGSDLRMRDVAAARRWYGREPTAPELLAEACYSLPELTGAPSPLHPLIANPGCFATAIALAVAPLAPHVAAGASVAVVGATGSSGSGIEPAAGVHHTLRVDNYVAYKTLTHQHLGEVTQLLASRGRVPRLHFVPHSLPAPRGILVTAVVPREALAADPREVLRDAYAGRPFVDVVDGEVPMGAVRLSNVARLGVVAGDDAWVVFCAIDNLLKGGSGQAVQNLNLAEGWDETAGLPVVGVWP